MLTPANVSLVAYRGGTFDPLIVLWSDASHTTPFDLTGYTVTFVVRDHFSLTAGSGLTVTAATGEVQLDGSEAQTLSVQDGSTIRAWLMLEKDGDTVFPLSGTIVFRDP